MTSHLAQPCSGAKRIRTADLLGAIQDPWYARNTPQRPGSTRNVLAKPVRDYFKALASTLRFLRDWTLSGRSRPTGGTVNHASWATSGVGYVLWSRV